MPGATYVATTNVSVPPGDSIQIDNETTNKALKDCISSPCSVNYKPADINGDELVAFLFSDAIVVRLPPYTFSPLAWSNVFFTFYE